MAKCKRCGKWGLFLKLNSFGQCEKCEKELAEAARLERERKKAAFWEELNNLPHAEIRRDGVKQKAQPVSYLKEAMTYPRVTAKSNAAKFADFVVLDTETTGLSCTKDVVLEVAAIKVKSFKFVEVFHTMITPPPQKLSMDSAREAMSVNGITPEMLEGAPMLYQIIPSLQEFIGDMPLLGHNLEFDLKFLCRAGLDVTPETRRFYDTYELAGHLLKKPKWTYDRDSGGYGPNYSQNYDVMDYKLETLCAHFWIDRMDAHRALGDCVDTAKVFRYLLEKKIDTTAGFDS